MKCSLSRQTGLWLFGGGGVLLAATWLAASSAAGAAVDASALRLGLAGGSLLLGMGLVLVAGFHGRSAQPRLDPPAEPFARPDHPCTMPADLLRELEDWLDHTPAGAGAWNAFDQFAREMLARHARAHRVRCFEVAGDAGRLRALSPAGSDPDATGEETASGLLAAAIRTGQTQLADGLGTADPADAATPRCDPWALAWPVKDDQGVIGVIAVGDPGPGGSAALTRTTTVLAYLGLFWRYISLRERLQTARVTDRKTGVLTRDEFFAQARQTTGESHRQGEPLAVAALTLEGLRGLDDKGMWTVRDTLVEEVGRTLLAKLRSDDLVGRLSDDRFVFLMRRIDGMLGRLIARNILEEVQRRIARHREFDGRVGVRLGLAGGDLRPATLETLLADAWSAVETARSRGEPLWSHDGESDTGGRP